MYIDSDKDLAYYKASVASKLIYIVPLLENSRDHFVKSKPIAFYVYCEGMEYVFPFKHPESVYNNYTVEDVLCQTKSYFYNKLVLDYNKILAANVYDMELIHYLNSVEPLNVEQADTEYFYSRMHSRYSKTNNLVSLANFVKQARSIVGQANLSSEHGLSFYDKIQTLLFQIECNGIHVDKKYFTPIYGTPINLIDDKVYTKYNLYTTTGRPSNRFGGINFAALNKQDDTRKSFVSRFDNGKLVELDFKAYHPHIIAYLCNYNFDKQDVYEHLAKYYFSTETPTKEQITNSKELTFNQVYGGINRKYLNIPFFAKVKEFTATLYSLYREQGYVESSISGRRFFVTDDTDLTDTKLFNYYIQMTETELNGLFLDRILSKIDTFYTQPILYTYDAVVFDCKSEYIDILVGKIIESTNDNFPITVKVGDNYKEMTNYTYEATTTVHIHRQH